MTLCQLFSYLSPFLFTATAPTEIYTLSLHDALPIYLKTAQANAAAFMPRFTELLKGERDNVRKYALWQLNGEDRKSTRLNSSHITISYAVFCLKKKKKHEDNALQKKKRSHTVATTPK